jgi:hypothetical protein
MPVVPSVAASPTSKELSIPIRFRMYHLGRGLCIMLTYSEVRPNRRGTRPCPAAHECPTQAARRLAGVPGGKRSLIPSAWIERVRAGGFGCHSSPLSSQPLPRRPPTRSAPVARPALPRLPRRSGLLKMHVAHVDAPSEAVAEFRRHGSSACARGVLPDVARLWPNQPLAKRLMTRSGAVNLPEIAGECALVRLRTSALGKKPAASRACRPHRPPNFRRPGSSACVIASIWHP